MPEGLKLLAFPLVGAAIGWFTNYLAIKMLFKPRQAVSLLGFRIQGLIPKRRTDLAHRLSETITSDLIGSVEQHLPGEENRPDSLIRSSASGSVGSASSPVADSGNGSDKREQLRRLLEMRSAETGQSDSQTDAQS